jgi:MFS family permease
MLLGRLVTGLGAGAASVLVPRYLAEIAPVAIRGTLGTLTQVKEAGPHGNIRGTTSMLTRALHLAALCTHAFARRHSTWCGRLSVGDGNLQVFVNVGIVASYLVGLPYEDSDFSADLLGHQVAWW